MTEGKPKVPSTTTVETLLTADVADELSSRAEDWPDFTRSLLARIADETLADDGSVLRAEVASPEEQADAPLLDEFHPKVGGLSVHDLLQRETESALADTDFSAFSQEVELGLDAETMAPQIGAALRADVENELSSRAPDWERFAQDVAFGLDAEAMAPVVGDALRKATDDELARREADWKAFGQDVAFGIDAEAMAPVIGDALRKATDDELARREADWEAFGQDVAFGIDAEMMAPVIGATLRQEVETELTQRAPDWAAFTEDVLTGLNVDAHQETVAAWVRQDIEQEVATRENEWSELANGVQVRLSLDTLQVSERLREARDAELKDQASAWTAFSAQVMDRIESDSTADARLSLEDRAISALKDDVAAEVESRAAQFDGTFQYEVERRISQKPTPAEDAPSVWTRLRRWLKPESTVGWGMVATAAAVVLTVYVKISSDPIKPIPNALPGQVLVERVSFEGSVTVMPDDGVTVVWLSDA